MYRHETIISQWLAILWDIVAQGHPDRDFRRGQLTGLYLAIYPCRHGHAGALDLLDLIEATKAAIRKCVNPDAAGNVK